MVPLFSRLKCNDVESVKLLLEFGADPTIESFSEDGMSPMDLLSMSPDADMKNVFAGIYVFFPPSPTQGAGGFP